MKYAGVKYLSSKKGQIYDYLSIEGVEVGDIVVVPTQFGLSVAQVKEMRDTSSVRSALQIAHIISDASPVFKEMRDKVRRETLHKKIQERIEAIVENARYEEYAKLDPVIKELNDKLQSMR